MFNSSSEFVDLTTRAAEDVAETFANASLLFFSSMLLMFCAIMPRYGALIKFLSPNACHTVV